MRTSGLSAPRGPTLKGNAYMIRSFRSLIVGGAVLGFAVSAWAVKPATWNHESVKDFADGKYDNVVLSSEAELMLSRKVHILHETKEQAYVVNALARGPDGAIYAATGGDGWVLQIKGDETKEFARLPEKNVFSLLFAGNGMLLAGTGGERGKIYSIDAAGKSSVFFQASDVKYVWAMARAASGDIYAATGVEGKLYRISPDGKTSRVLFDAQQKNLLCLAIDASGMIYTGTDTDGLVFRLSPDGKQPYALYDATETEISAIALDGQGNVYAATASADTSKPGRDFSPRAGGKPDGGRTTTTTSHPTAATIPAAMLSALKAAGMQPARLPAPGAAAATRFIASTATDSSPRSSARTS